MSCTEATPVQTSGGRCCELSRALTRVGAGDRLAFDHLYGATYAKLMATCLRVLDNRQVAEDVLQDVYVSVWLKAATYDGQKGSPITWLVAIARNRALDELRAAPGRRKNEPLDEHGELADGGMLASDRLETQEQVDKLHLCLSGLDVRHRDAIRAAFFDGMTYEQVANRENVPHGTMKSWISRGLGKLKVGMAA